MIGQLEDWQFDVDANEWQNRWHKDLKISGTQAGALIVKMGGLKGTQPERKKTMNQMLNTLGAAMHKKTQKK